MSSRILFIIMLLVGGLLTYLGIKMSGKTRIISILIGAIVMLIGAFGVFTSLLWRVKESSLHNQIQWFSTLKCYN